jgi:hypothetical protein
MHTCVPNGGLCDGIIFNVTVVCKVTNGSDQFYATPAYGLAQFLLYSGQVLV